MLTAVIVHSVTVLGGHDSGLHYSANRMYLPQGSSIGITKVGWNAMLRHNHSTLLKQAMLARADGRLVVRADGRLGARADGRLVVRADGRLVARALSYQRTSKKSRHFRPCHTCMHTHNHVTLDDT